MNDGTLKYQIVKKVLHQFVKFPYIKTCYNSIIYLDKKELKLLKYFKGIKPFNKKHDNQTNPYK